MDTKAKKCLSESEKKLRHKICKKRWRDSEKGHKKHRLWNWENHSKIIGDLPVYYDILMETNKCDFCECSLAIGHVRPSSNSKTLDHCHNCGMARGVLCNTCNLKDRLKCILCD